MAADRTSASQPSLEQLLDAQVCELDKLIGEVRGGIRNAGHFDRLEERATQISTGVRGAFRNGRIR